MITQAKIPLCSEKRIRNDFAYNVYGAWMSMLKPEYADIIHESNSISQFIVPDTSHQKKALMTVNLLSEESAAYMLPLLESTNIYVLKKQQCTVTAGEPIINKINEKDIFTGFIPQGRQSVTIRFVSPAAFKNNGRYAIFPTSDLITKSAVSKFNKLNLGVCISNEETIIKLMESVLITGYCLNSTHYYFKGTRIQSFLGNVTLSVRAPAPLERLFLMLMGTIRYTGIGIKTALGMGGVEIV